MERPTRRFIPLPDTVQESLEERLCMTSSQLAGGLPGLGQETATTQPQRTSTVAGFGSTSNPYSVRRETRIERLPGSFAEIDPTQRIPRDITAALQADLQALMNTLDGRSQYSEREAMNQLFRAMIPSNSVSAASMTALNKVFGDLLISAGGNPATVASLQANMLKASQAAIQSSSQPSFAIMNNYVFMYFASTTVGYAIPTPPAPALLPRLNQNPNGDPVTASRRPQFTGRYPKGMIVEILDVSDGKVIGRGVSQSSGRFNVVASNVMEPGVYTLTARGTTPAGETSEYSPWTTLTITSTQAASRQPG